MTDKKLTDSEIVKALECCAERVDYEGNEDTCCSCSLITDNCCTCTLSKQALDLINRLQAENMVLKDDLDYFKKINAERNISALKGTIQTAKAEAYKECIEKVKEGKEILFFGDSGYHYRITDRQLDNLLKELVGDK